MREKNVRDTYHIPMWKCFEWSIIVDVAIVPLGLLRKAQDIGRIR